MPAKSTSVAVPAALLALVFWGGTAIANRYAVGFADPIVVATLRSMLAGGVALLIALALKLRRPANRGDQLLLLLASAVHRNAPSRSWWLGGCMALAAAFFLIIDRGSSLDVADPASAAIGDLIILLGCVLCAAGYVAGGKLSPKIGAFATTFWGLSIALIVTMPTFAIYQQGTDWTTLPLAAWWAIAWLTVCSSLLGYVLWFFALGRGGIEKIGSLQLLMPVITLLGAVLILKEIFTLQLALLAGLVLAGTVIAHGRS